jgi:hypothetical protein
MKKVILITLFITSFVSFSQVGLGTSSPLATLDVRESDPSAPTAKAGIAIPQVNTLPLTGNRAGQLIYFTTNNSYYYYDGTIWQPLKAQIFTFGDVKYGLQTTDHNGWVLLNGRAISTLNSSQNSVAISIGMTANLINISDKNIVGVSGTKTLRSTNGNASVSISQNQLPNVSLTTSSDGLHNHNYSKTTSTGLISALLSIIQIGNSNSIGGLNTATDVTTSNGTHAHSVALNGGVTQQSLNVQNPYIALNGFVYLGL